MTQLSANHQNTLNNRRDVIFVRYVRERRKNDFDVEITKNVSLWWHCAK